MLVQVRDGFETRKSNADIEMDDAPSAEVAKTEVIYVEEQDDGVQEIEGQQNIQSEFISFHLETKPLHEIVGESEIISTHVGGKDPTKMGFRRQGELFNEIQHHTKETQYIPQMGHQSRVDQQGMGKYRNWTTDILYGKVILIGPDMAVFADPTWGDCRFDRKVFREGGYNHAAVQKYTRRWNKVLRHDTGHSGPSRWKSSSGTTMHGRQKMRKPGITLPAGLVRMSLINVGKLSWKAIGTPRRTADQSREG